MKSVVLICSLVRTQRNCFPVLPVSRRIVFLLLWFLNFTLQLTYAEESRSAKTSAAEVLREPRAPGDARSQYDLGVFLEKTRKYDEAVSSYRKAAEKGLAAAQNNLGFCYQEGQGIPRSYTEAIKWYRKAAGQGFAAAQNNLGVCYRDGTGVTKDLKQAVRWFRSGAEQGLAAAQNNLGVRYYKGEGVMTNFTEAVNWYRKASEQRLADAFVNLGICYVDGRGVPRDRIQAYIYFDVAAAQGDAYAPQIRKFLEKQMTPREISEGQRRSFAFISGALGDPANRDLP
ncbi:MAG: tetratricopeptide repeat protein [Verrucomicrobiota bacterium]